MDEVEKYNFDLNGFILVKKLLSTEDVSACLLAAKELEPRVARTIDLEPIRNGKFGIRYHIEEKLGCSWYKSDAGALQYIVEDFINASGSFDCLIAHKRTMEYVQAFMRGPYHMTSAELRFRYRGNYNYTHMGGPIDPRNRYEFLGRRSLEPRTGARDIIDFDLLCIRVLYALHDIPLENGSLSVVPGSHKSNFFSPFGNDPDREPGMVGISMEAGDAIFFTENLRHGGFRNLLDNPRITMHFVISPTWVGSQSPAHWDDHMYVSPKTFARYSAEQKALFPSVASSPNGTTTLGPVLGADDANPQTYGSVKSDQQERKMDQEESAKTRDLTDKLSQALAELQSTQEHFLAMKQSRTWRTAKRIRATMHRLRMLKPQART